VQLQIYLRELSPVQLRQLSLMIFCVLINRP
jgi:hypothetical protein